MGQSIEIAPLLQGGRCSLRPPGHGNHLILPRSHWPGRERRETSGWRAEAGAGKKGRPPETEARPVCPNTESAILGSPRRPNRRDGSGGANRAMPPPRTLSTTAASAGPSATNWGCYRKGLAPGGRQASVWGHRRSFVFPSAPGGPCGRPNTSAAAAVGSASAQQRLCPGELAVVMLKHDLRPCLLCPAHGLFSRASGRAIMLWCESFVT